MINNQPKNFRDVGETLNQLGNDSNIQIFQPGRIFRGGQIDYLNFESFGSPSTIFNLRMQKDDENFKNVAYFHFPIANSVNKYDTKNKVVKEWLCEIVKTIEKGNLVFPIYIHCFAGKDRTGIVVAALLQILGVPKSLIVKEFSQSSEVTESDIESTLNELEKKGRSYYRGIDLIKVQRQLRGDS